MITETISNDAFKLMTLNLLLCILDEKSDVDEQARYRAKLDTITSENIEMLAKLVRDRKLLKNDRSEIYDTTARFFQKAKRETAYGMGDYWRNKYGINAFEVSSLIQNNFNYTRGCLGHAVFGEVK